MNITIKYIEYIKISKYKDMTMNVNIITEHIRSETIRKQSI